MDFVSKIGQNIRFLRKKAKIPQSELADRANISLNYISLIENGKKSASIHTLNNIAQVLGVELKELFTFTASDIESKMALDILLKIFQKRPTSDIIFAADILGKIFNRVDSN